MASKKSRSRYIFINGALVPELRAKVSVFDNGFLYGDGVYETMRTYGGAVWQVSEHLKRLRRSAAMIKIRVPWTDRELRRFISDTVKKNGFEESRIRLTLTRGANGFDFATSPHPTLVIQAGPLVPEPSWVYAKGVSVVTARISRVLPEAKTISLLPFVLARQIMGRRKAYEALFVDSRDMVHEGTVTNVYAVKKGVLYTPGKNILNGTTRRKVLGLARKAGVRVVTDDLPLKKLVAADEVFITNAPRGIVPVVTIDGKIISKRPGTLTRRLMEEFQKVVKNAAKH